MISNEDYIIEEDSSAEIENELLASKFKNFGRENFQYFSNIGIDYGHHKKEVIRFYKFPLPFNLREYFIKKEEAPLFWVLESPLLRYLSEFYKGHFAKTDIIEQQKFLSDYYSKWAIIKSDSEKKFYSVSALNVLDKKVRENNFLLLILHGVILTFEKSCRNIQKALQLFEKARNAVAILNLEENFKEELDYLIDIYVGFAHLHDFNFESANDVFSQALAIKPFGITAKYYLALTEFQLDHIEVGSQLVEEIITYDIQRLEQAVESRNSVMFSYLFKNSVSPNIFEDNRFVMAIDNLEGVSLAIRAENEGAASHVKHKIEEFKLIKITEYYARDTERDVAFLENLLNVYSENKNVLFLGAVPKITKLYQSILDGIFNTIRERHYQEIKSKLNFYEITIHDIELSIEKLKQDLEQNINGLKERMTHAKAMVENSISESVAALEERINNIHNVQRLDPKLSFNTTMVYTVLLSFSVFLLGGCAKYSFSYMKDMSEIKDWLGSVLIAGVKWGLITFLIGFVVSIIMAGLTQLEKASQKQKLLQRISALKNEKEKQLEYINTDYKEAEKSLRERISQKIEELKNNHKELKEKKELDEQGLKEVADKRIDKECEPLKPLMIS